MQSIPPAGARRSGLALTTAALLLAPAWSIAQQPETEPNRREAQAEAPAAPDAPQAFAAPGRYYVGIVLDQLAPLTRAQLGLQKNVGVAVAMVAENSPAAKAGIQQYDVVVAIGDTPLTDAMQLLEAVQASEGKPVAMEIIRAGKRQTVEVTPRRTPQAKADETGEPPQLRALLRRFAQLEQGQGPLRLRRVGPGVEVPPELEVTDLPDGMKVKVLRQEGEPAKVVIQQGEETWEATEKDVNQLPERFRKLASGLLRSVGGVQVEVDAGQSPDVRIRRFPFSRDRDQDRALEQRMERIERELKELKERIKQGKAELESQAPADGAATAEDRAT